MLKTDFQQCSTRLDQSLGKDTQGVFIFEREPQVFPGFMGFPVTTMIEEVYSVEVTVIFTPWTGGLPWQDMEIGVLLIHSWPIGNARERSIGLISGNSGAQAAP